MREPSSGAPKPANQYRPDIDGLRAVAVLSVILYHMNSALIPGGFVGVDIFFVISGYLITLHILRDMDAGRFSLLDFYRRRVKRIAPVMLVVIAVVMLASLVVLRPEDTDKVGRTAFAALASLANVYFWLFEDTSYFAQASQEVPLLHLWSLGVEEQFYIFWPLVLMVAYQTIRGRHFLGILGLVSVLSFLLGEVLFLAEPAFVYYMLPTRAGELMLGALSAYLVTKKPDLRIHGAVTGTAAIGGVVLIVGSLTLLNEEVVFPGLNALPPTLGTAALILAGHYGNSLPVRLLTLRPLVYLGLISYSAYLWHWPLMAFARYAGVNFDLVIGPGIFVATLLLASASYRWIERPTRRYQGTAWQVIIRMYAIPAGMLMVFSLAMVFSRGMFLHVNAEAYALLQGNSKPAYAYDYVCQSWELTDADLSNPACVLGKPDAGGVDVLLWGDSQAAHYVGMLGAFAEHAEFRFRNAQHSSCPPIDSDPIGYVPAKRLDNCRRSLERVLSVIHAYDTVIVSSAWTAYGAMSEVFFDAFFDTVRALTERGKQVILLGQIPDVPRYDRVCHEKAITLTWMQCEYADNPLSPAIAAVNERLRAFAYSTDGVAYFDIVDHLCPDGLCSAYDAMGDALYFDSTHLSLPASWKLGRKVLDANAGVPAPFAPLAK
jgi:peptidoglycan/LPS O-acetylase OafA/YrhL